MYSSNRSMSRIRIMSTYIIVLMQLQILTMSQLIQCVYTIDSTVCIISGIHY